MPQNPNNNNDSISSSSFQSNKVPEEYLPQYKSWLKIKEINKINEDQQEINKLQIALQQQFQQMQDNQKQQTKVAQDGQYKNQYNSNKRNVNKANDDNFKNAVIKKQKKNESNKLAL